MGHFMRCTSGLAIIMLTAFSANALQTTVYVDKTLWAIAAGGQFQTEAFDDAELNQGVSYTSSESGNISNGFYHDVLQSTSQNSPMTTWYFSPQITAYGGNWTLGGPGGSGPSLLVNIGNLSVGAISNDYNGEFWGFVADGPIASVSLVGGPGSNQQNYKLDDMVYSPVPVPGAIWLLGGGLAALLGRRRIPGFPRGQR